MLENTMDKCDKECGLVFHMTSGHHRLDCALGKARIETEWLEHEALVLGTENQRERWRAGVLPEDELLQIARAELFKGFGQFTRWHSNHGRREMLLGKRPAKHSATCTTRDYVTSAWHYLFEVADVAELDGPQWETLKQIQDAAEAVCVHPWMVRQGRRAEVESCTHWATCKECKAEVSRSVAKVSIPWAGHILVREFSLQGGL